MIGLTNQRAPGFGRISVAPGALAIAAGVAVASGDRWMPAGLVIAALPLAALFIARVFRDAHTRIAALSVEVPLVLVIMSDLTLRIRTTESLSANPFDAAGMLRAGLQGGALLLAAIALLSHRQAVAGAPRLTTRPFRVYMLYVLVAAAGIATSTFPVLTAYRVFEVAVGVVVVLGALHAGGPSAVDRIGKTLYWYMVATAVMIWLNVFAAPHLAITAPRNSPIPWQIHSVFPAISSNSVGFYGVVLLFLSIGRILYPRSTDKVRRGVLVAMAGLGLITLLAAQYRTGYVAFLVGTVILLAMRGRKALAVLAVAVIVVMSIWGGALRTTAEPFVLRGVQADRLADLNGRVDWWNLAIPVWKTSPIVGRGLLTGTRFALGSGGFGDTNTVHSTWIEALVGTGILGITLLGGALLISIKRAARARDITPLILLIAISVRSVTGQTIDSFRVTTILFLWATLSIPDRANRREHR